MAEGSETPGGEGDGGHGPAGRRPPGRSEGDLLAERRARRAAETGEAALTLRAEAAEATVQTLERHVSSLQARMREADEERRVLAESLEAEKVLAQEREQELRHVKQREYAEQQLRAEAEERLLATERESHEEIGRLSARMQAGEDGARELAHSLNDVQRQLAEAERRAAAERAGGLVELRAAVERELEGRLAGLERRVAEAEVSLERDRDARERSERLLERMRRAHLQMGDLIGEMKGILERLLGALATGEPAGAAASGAATEPRPALATTPHALPTDEPRAGLRPRAPGVARAPERLPADAIAEARGAEMSDALIAAVERLRARAEAAPAVPEQPSLAPIVRPPHRHSMSWLARRRIKRKQRRA
jgi:hypothetical protein